MSHPAQQLTRVATVNESDVVDLKGAFFVLEAVQCWPHIQRFDSPHERLAERGA